MILYTLLNSLHFNHLIYSKKSLTFKIMLSKSHLLIIGENLYTDYGIIFLLGSINLLVAMVGVIYLIILNYPIRKLQSIIIQSKTNTTSYTNFFKNNKNKLLLNPNLKWNNIELYYFKNKQQNYTYRK